MQLADFLKIEQFSIPSIQKTNILFSFLRELHVHHYQNSKEYSQICDKIFPNHFNALKIEDLPFLPVSLFKKYELKSIPDSKIYKILTSSGTTGTIPSKIFLDAETANLQTLALSKIISNVMGNERLPMLIVDSKSVLSNRNSFSARAAGILGLSVFGKNHFYLLNDKFEVDYEGLNLFLERFKEQRILIFGFTFMIWQYLLVNNKLPQMNLRDAILFHSGGWKKLIELQVSNEQFKMTLYNKLGINSIYNFYGMVEQVGSIYLENRKGFLHCPNFSEVIIRNPKDFSVQPDGQEGLVQVISVLPRSYPGHSILTEDIGVCIGSDNVDSNWRGKCFQIIGRAQKAELRGCSDTFVK